MCLELTYIGIQTSFTWFVDVGDEIFSKIGEVMFLLFYHNNCNIL